MYITPAVVTLAVAGALTAVAATTHRHSTDILHFFDHVHFANSGVVTNAVGQVDARQNQQGNANNQTLDLHLRGLETNTTYYLYALTGDDTNWTAVTSFGTDSRGRSELLFRQLGNGHGLGRGKLELPASLTPVSNVRDLAVFNVNTQAVLTADLTAPERLEYLVKRDLSTTNVDAVLRLHGSATRTQFRLTASGLAPTNDYYLVLNGGITETNQADARGRLDIRSTLLYPGDVLDLHTLELWDTSSNVVLSTTLP